MIDAKILGIVLAAFATGAFLASPELRAYASTIANDVICTGCVGTADLGGNAVTTAKIKDGEVKTMDIGNGAVNSAKIADNSVTAADIGASAVRASEIATDAVGAAELQGVTKLLYGVCVVTYNDPIPAGSGVSGFGCAVPGAAQGDSAVATLNGYNNPCLTVTKAVPGNVGVSFNVALDLMNVCTNPQTPGTVSIGVIVFHK